LPWASPFLGPALDPCVPAHIPLWHRPRPLCSHFKPSRHAIAFGEHRSRRQPAEFLLGNWGGPMPIPDRRSLAFLGLRGFTGSLAAIALIFSGLHFTRPATTRVRTTKPPGRLPGRLARPVASRLCCSPAPAFLFVCRRGDCLGGWVAAYEKRMPGMDSSTWALAPLVFTCSS